ncbi:transposase [Bradyrhizobium diazoefficiens]|nr:transposase [Bradyrhizobium diazoefficiens]
MIGTSRSGQADPECFVESVNGRMRDELLNETPFFDLDHARAKICRLPTITVTVGTHR